MEGSSGWRKEGCLGARQYNGWYHGDVMALEEQARGVMLHWKMHNVSGEGGGSRVSSSSIRDGGLRLYSTRSLFQVLAGGWGLVDLFEPALCARIDQVAAAAAAAKEESESSIKLGQPTAVSTL